MPKISVIVPCYNQGQFVDEAVESILAQTYQDFEIIIINDGSTDKLTIDKLKNYSRPKTIIYHTLNSKLPATRNFGIRKSTGEYILTLDADDKFCPTFIERAAAILDAKPNVGIVSSHIEAFGTFSLINREFKSGGVETFLDRCNSHASAMFRRKCFDECGGYNEKMTDGMEDWDFWINITKRNWNIEIISEPLSLYRQHELAMSHDTYKLAPEIIKQIAINHREVFEKNVVEVIYAKEKHKQAYVRNQKLVVQENDRLRQLIKDIQSSWSYRVGNRIVNILNFMKGIFHK